VVADPPLPSAPAAHHLHADAVRLAARLDKAGQLLAAAYVSMAVDAIEGSAAFGQGRDDPSTGSGRAGRAGSRDQSEAMVNGVLRQAQDDRSGGGVAPVAIDLDFTLDEQGRVWMIREGDCYVLGPTDPVCGEMRRFLTSVAAGGDGYG
jgi:hypothetical protein